MAALRKALDRRENKTIYTDSLIELTELVRRNNIYEHDGTFFKQNQGTAESIVVKTFMSYLDARR